MATTLLTEISVRALKGSDKQSGQGLLGALNAR